MTDLEELLIRYDERQQLKKLHTRNMSSDYYHINVLAERIGDTLNDIRQAYREANPEATDKEVEQYARDLHAQYKTERPDYYDGPMTPKLVLDGADVS
jgi:hypothetical protein